MTEYLFITSVELNLQGAAKPTGHAATRKRVAVRVVVPPNAPRLTPEAARLLLSIVTATIQSAKEH